MNKEQRMLNIEVFTPAMILHSLLLACRRGRFNI